MKKSVFFCLALGSLAGMASAQSSVTMYGIVDLSLAHESNGAGNTNKMESGVYNGSRLGFKGAEDLGGGLTANFQLEMGINADDGSSAQGGILFGRQSWVGLAGVYGSVRMGRQYAPVYLAQLTVDPFVGGMKGDMTNVRGWFNGAGFRINNSVAYYTPSWNGLTGAAIYGLGEVAGNNAAGRTWGLSATYGNGPVGATFAYHRTNNTTGTDNAAVWFTGATYDFGVVKVHGAIDNTQGPTNTKIRNAMLGLSAPLAGGRVMASYIRKDNRVVSDADAHQWALGYVYDLSKRTALYTSYAHVNNEKNVGVNAGGVNGATDKVLDVGIRHSF